MEITPLVPAGRQLIQTYGNGGFTIAGIHHVGSVLVFPEHTQTWPVSAIETVTRQHLQVVADTGTEIDFLLLGAGIEVSFFRPELRLHLSDAGIAVEVMDTGAACRTFNVLLAEGRRIAAALIAVK